MNTDRIAIVGMAARFPGSGPDLDKFWRNVAAAADCSRAVPAGRWTLPPDQCLDPRVANPDTVYSARGYFLDPFTPDPKGWNAPVPFVAGLDTLFHTVLDAGHRAWKSAKTDKLDRARVGVVLGNICLPTEKASDLAREYLGGKWADALGTPREARRTNPLNRYVAGLPAGVLAKTLNLGGGTYTLDAACASSLYALKLACDELQAGRADAMLAGGANGADPLYTQMGFAQLRALSQSGRCSPFDSRADGLMVGEGAGVFVLKRAADAVRDGDHIHGLICGWGLSNDRSGNLLAPAVEGQVRAMAAAYKRAGWSPTDVDLVECHATGTPVGDAVEFESLRQTWGTGGWRPGRTVIGSVKSTVGHLLTGAGAAAVAKVLKAFAAKQLPPQANFSTPNASLPGYDGGPFRVLQQAEPWEPRKATTPRRAAVSGFGFGGVNAHLLIEENIGQVLVTHLSLPPVVLAKPLPKLSTVSAKKATQRQLPAPEPHAPAAAGEPVAVVGMAAHVGPWVTLREFQEYVLGGAARPEPTVKTNGWGLASDTCPPGFYVESVAAPLDRFRTPPRELEEMLPQQLLILQTAAAALDDCVGHSGIGSRDRDGQNSESGSAIPVPAQYPSGLAEKTGVFVGLGLDLNTTNFHLRWAAKKAGAPDDAFLDAVAPPLTADRTMGALGSIAASRVARMFGFGGPSFTVCSEESSAGRAIELAVRALRNNELDRAVAGGVDLTGDPRGLLATAQDRAVSATGTANPLDPEANGFLPGEGAACVVLKRLADAERDGDRVYAVIRGVGSASGGPVTEFGPEGFAYRTAVKRACADGQVPAETIGYLDGAATGSPADDIAEASGIVAVLGGPDRRMPLSVGAVRGQVGNPGAASAAVGLVKACLALHHRIVPPTVPGEAVRPELEFVAPRCHWSRSPRYWLADEADGPRRAAVASVGVDGSVTHVVLEEWIPSPLVEEGRAARMAAPAAPPTLGAARAGIGNRDSQTAEPGSAIPIPAPYPFADPQPLGARHEAVFAAEADEVTDLAVILGRLAEWAEAHAGRGVELLAREWLKEHPPSRKRRRAVALVARSAEELLEQARFARDHVRHKPATPLPDPAAKDPNPTFRDRVFFAPTPVGPKGKLAVVFPGSGNHFPGMGRDLSAAFPDVLRQQEGENRELRGQYAPDKFWADAIPEDTTAKQFLFGQVTLGTLTADVLARLGVRFDAMIGLSLGESTGLFATRVWKSRDEMFRRVRESTLFGPDLGPPYNAARTFWGWPKDQPLDWVTAVLSVPPDEVKAALKPGLKAFLLIANTLTESVVGGVRADVEKLADQFGRPFLPLPGVTLAHCEAGRPVEIPYRELHTLPTTKPDGMQVYSGAWGRTYIPTTEEAAASITAGLVGVIDFPAVVEAAYRDGVRAFVECGPGNSCTRMVSAILGGRPHLARAATAPRQDAVSLVLRLVANLVAERLPVDLAVLYSGPTKCVGHRDATPPPSRALTIPVGMPPRELPAVAPAPTDDKWVLVPDDSPFLTPGPPLTEPADADRAAEIVLDSASKVQPVPEPRPAEPAPALSPELAAMLAPFVAACADTQAASAAAHDMFLRVQHGFVNVTAAALQLHTTLSRVGHSLREWPLPAPEQSPMSQEVSSPKPATRGASGPPESVPRSLSTEECFEFARGKIAAVLGNTFAAVDAFPTRVRLPDGPLMLVDRILAIEGEPRSMTHGRVVTDHHVHANRWYLDAGRIPTCVAVEAGQADLFLSGFLSIDFETRGLAVYRLIDAVVTFHRPLPVVGETILYDIRIDGFVKQGDSWLFRFRFDSTVNGEPLLTMRHGVAGFFTAEALASGKGIVHTKLDRQAIPGKRPENWRDLVPLASCALGPKEVAALRAGDLVGAFGADFANASLRSPMKLPGGMLRLLDRVPTLDPAGGRFGLGFVRAEYDIAPDDWFLTCHFVDDQVMPGTLMYECCLHTLRVLLMRIGWVGEDGEVACEPVPGVSSRLKCRGQVIATTKVVAYEVSVKELGYGPEPFAIADALMYADGKPIVEILNMTLRMSGLTQEKLEAVWASPSNPLPLGERVAVGRVRGILPEENRDIPGQTISLGVKSFPSPPAPLPQGERGDRIKKPAIYDSAKILAYSNGNPSEAFGEPYRVFDRDRIIARLPGPPFQFLDRITMVKGEPFVLKAGAACEAQYDVPPDAWYFAENRSSLMPFSVLLEIALQPCGWLAAYCGSALTSDTDLSFRNLGGKAKQFLPVTPDVGTLTINVTMTNVSQSAGMIIQNFTMLVECEQGKVYEGTTYFGFFGKEALTNQIGMPTAKVPYLSAEQKAIAESGRLPHDPPFPGPKMRMVDRIDGYLPTGGRAGLGLVQGSVTVDPSFWFFAAHFYQDPVWPGSLGLESFLQLLKFAAWKRWGDAEWQTVGLNVAHEWVYRGQVVPRDREVIVVLEVTAVDESAKRLTADGFLTVDGRVIYQMIGFTLEVAAR